MEIPLHCKPEAIVVVLRVKQWCYGLVGVMDASGCGTVHSYKVWDS